MGAAAFYRSNKLDTTRLVIHWQVSQGPASLTRQEEETEIKEVTEAEARADERKWNRVTKTDSVVGPMVQAKRRGLMGAP